MSRTNEARHIEQHETCKCKCRLNAKVCNNKQRWNKDKCRCECKELIEKGKCHKGFIWNASNCVCHGGEYIDYQNWKKKCREKLVNVLVGECSENIDQNDNNNNRH